MHIESVLPPDAIPSIDAPRFGATYVGDDTDEVLVVEASPPRAYPIRILNFHEIANDVVDGDPLAVTWCPLCGSAIVYERVVGGRTLTFGVSGKLADDDLVMYDRETGSEWKQSLGECIAGELVGERLELRPASIVTWERFRADHPEGVVLQPEVTESEAASDTDEPEPVDYAMEPYDAYFDSAGYGLAAHRGLTGARSWERDDLSPKTIVLGIERGGEAVGFPRPWVEAAGGVLTTAVGGSPVVVVATGSEVHAYADPGFDYEADGDVLRADGTTWDPATGRSADGRRLERVPAKRLFAFTWQDDHGPEAFHRPGG